MARPVPPLPPLNLQLSLADGRQVSATYNPREAPKVSARTEQPDPPPPPARARTSWFRSLFGEQVKGRK